jgi:hypothetical protein
MSTHLGCCATCCFNAGVSFSSAVEHASSNEMATLPAVLVCSLYQLYMMQIQRIC